METRLIRLCLPLTLLFAGCIWSGQRDPLFADFSLSEATVNGSGAIDLKGREDFTVDLCGAQVNFRPSWSRWEVFIDLRSDRGSTERNSFRLLDADVKAEGLDPYLDEVTVVDHIGPPSSGAVTLPVNINYEQRVMMHAVGSFQELKDKTFRFSMLFECGGEPVSLHWKGRLNKVQPRQGPGET